MSHVPNVSMSNQTSSIGVNPVYQTTEDVPRSRQHRELGFKFSGRPIAQAGMQALLILHLLQEVCQVKLCLLKGLIGMQVHFLDFDRLEKAFGLGIVQRGGPCRHADLGSAV